MAKEPIPCTMQDNAVKACWIFFILSTLLFSCAPNYNSAKGKVNKIFRSWIENPSFVSANIGVHIEDINYSHPIISLRSDKNFIPASNIKIFTSYALMKSGMDSILSVAALLDSNGRAYLIPFGDPSFLHPDFSEQKLFQWLKKCDTVYIQENNTVPKYRPGWAWEDFDRNYMPELSTFPIYGNTITLYKNNDTSYVVPSYFSDSLSQSFYLFRRWFDKNIFMSNNVKNGLSVQIPFIPKKETIASLLKDTLGKTEVVWINKIPESSELKNIYSHPVDSLLRPMMYYSDNFLAEQMMINLTLTREMDTTSGISDEFLLPLVRQSANKPRWVDGSGLSRYNLCSPNYMVDILKHQWKNIPNSRILSVFPFGGSDGLPAEFSHLGKNIYAKTGSMSNVFCLSGYLFTEKERIFVFSIMVNGYTGNSALLREQIAKVLTALQKKY
jgi:D-alanyl-D-alanine carboxypeptidase/D-alanyl-D-alanine-endopeptidase (penicillin-binding protein 4)